jgi:ABC-type transport system substrate-binding protein
MRLLRWVHVPVMLVLFLALVLVVAPLAAQDDNILVITSLSDVNSLDPAVGYDTVSWAAGSLVYRGLMGYDADGVTLIPVLAESYIASEDGLVFTFTLREGAMFSNGREITADDVKYSFERLLNPATGSPGTFMYDIIAGASEVIAGEATEVSGIAVVEESTVSFTLTRPEWTFLQRLAVPFASIVAREGVEAAADFAREPLGAGPFILTAWETGLHLTFERNPNYYREGYPIVDGVRIDIGVDPSVMVLRVESGEADTAFDFVSQADYPRIADDATLAARLIQSAVPNIYYGSFNTREAPFDNAQVRQALSMAVDRDRIVQILNGRPIAADGLFPPNMQGNNPDMPPLPYDPEGARALLAEAGYPDGLSTQIYTSTDPQIVSAVQAIIQDWSEIGVQTELVSLEFSELLNIIYGENPGQMPVMFLNWVADYPDPSNFYQPLLQCASGNNTGAFCDENLDAMEAEAALLPFGDERWAAYAALEAAINEQTPWLFAYYSRDFFYTSERVQGLTAHPSYGLTFETASVQ